MTNAISIFNRTNIIRRFINRLQIEEVGQSIMEMAVVLPLLLLVTFSIIDGGRALYTASVVKAAAQEGARAGIIDQGKIMDAIEAKMIGLDMGSASVRVDTGTPDIIDVNITYEFVFVTPVIDALIDRLDLTGHASMVIQ